MNQFIVRVVFFNSDINLHIVKYWEVVKINEIELFKRFKDENTAWSKGTLKILFFQKMTYKELLEFSFNEYKTLFPDNVKIMDFKTDQGKYFTIERKFNNNDHERNYIRSVEEKNNKLIGITPKVYNHDL